MFCARACKDQRLLSIFGVRHVIRIQIEEFVSKIYVNIGDETAYVQAAYKRKQRREILRWYGFAACRILANDEFRFTDKYIRTYCDSRRQQHPGKPGSSYALLKVSLFRSTVKKRTIFTRVRTRATWKSARCRKTLTSLDSPKCISLSVWWKPNTFIYRPIRRFFYARVRGRCKHVTSLESEFLSALQISAET